MLVKYQDITANTAFPELNDVLTGLVSSVQRALGTTLVGAYLQGSLAVGGFDEHSDVDFIFVIDQELSDPQVESLQAVHQRIFNLDSEWAKHLEGSYFPTAILRSHDHSGDDLLYLEHGENRLVRSSHCNTVVVRWILRERGVVLSGPQPSTLIDPIPVSVLRHDMMWAIKHWGKAILAKPKEYNDRFYQSYIVLNFCRMLHDLHTGTCGSKRSGAEWAKLNLDRSWVGLIDCAWEGRPKPAVSIRQAANDTDFARTLDLVREVIRAANDFSAKENF
jgi:hypothetical protein